MDRPREPDLAARLFGSSPERALTLMRCAWPAAVGPELARRTEVVSFDAGQLRVRVPDAAWQKNLWRMRGDILARLRSIAGRAAPRSLGFVQGPVSAPAPPPAAPPRPHATAPPPSLVQAAAVIEDEALRAAFLAVAGRYLGRFSAAGEGSGAAGGASAGDGPGSPPGDSVDAKSAAASSAGTGTGSASGR
jgi:hypothetical protein